MRNLLRMRKGESHFIEGFHVDHYTKLVFTFYSVIDRFNTKLLESLKVLLHGFELLG